MVTCYYKLIGDLKWYIEFGFLGSLWERCGLALFVFPPTLTFLEVGDFRGSPQYRCLGHSGFSEFLAVLMLGVLGYRETFLEQ